MLTKSRLKLIKSLSRKKNRDEHQLFVVEGYKSIQELVQTHLRLEQVIVTSGNDRLDHLDPDVISSKEMQQISSLKTPPGYLAVFGCPVLDQLPDKGLVLALDNIQDPGNLGTIIRMCDWFGIEHIVCNMQTVDVYNPKCVQATMASLARVQVHYVDLPKWLGGIDLPLFNTAMDGDSIYDCALPHNAVMVMGNESSGISESIMAMGKKITIPSYSTHQSTESLNVATATAVVIAQWRRAIEM